jgi:hypothetical protein
MFRIMWASMPEELYLRKKLGGGQWEEEKETQIS